MSAPFANSKQAIGWGDRSNPTRYLQWSEPLSQTVVTIREVPKILTNRERYLRSITEKDWQAQIIEVLNRFKYRVFHEYDSRRNQPGYPDLAALHNAGDFFFVELKREMGKLTPEQIEVIAALERAGVTVFVWRPSQFDEVVTILQQRSQRH